MNYKYFFLFLALIVIIQNLFSQKLDTIYYDNGQIRSIESNENGEKKLLSFYNDSQEDLIDENNLEFTYFDAKMNMNRTVIIQNKIIAVEYWFNEKDTIYNQAKFDKGFDKNVQRFYEYVSKNLKYPKIAKRNKIDGRVYLSFIVNKKGKIEDIKPLTHLGYELEKSAVELLNSNTNWGIVYLNGKPVNCFFRLPIAFNL